MSGQKETPLVSTDWLAEHLDDPAVVIVECAAAGPDTAEYFSVGHIPGAHYAWWKDLCWHETDRQFPTADVLARRLEAFGMSDDHTLVLVGDTIQFATYPFWVMEMVGLSHLAKVLDGGRQIWMAENRPTTTDLPARPSPGVVTPGTADSGSRVGRDDVLAHLDDPGRVLLDMRSDEEYNAERVSPTKWQVDHGAERKGRIPGARHLYYERLLDEQGRFRSPDDLRAEFDGEGATPDVDAVTYCRLSHRASLGWFCATKLAGRNNFRVYDGSWTEWGSIVGVPIENS